MRRKSSDGNKSLASESKAREESESFALDVQTEKEERSPSPLLSPLHSLRSLVKKCSTGVTTGIPRDFS
ncbi:hypothetical protein SARC_17331 [Sphaeroforma arctica JP610]|uniref:Uncharacterized protein n=1 Tax=Sphaeroforma arctica JP610 TaxID=667725 RepID=A0A0L0F0H4_9EUKA|nr:hypothetical protein SARC_17331 [Sphaeroforma arctica JP610]KNC70146.1 hypothetical protein SARC_17331 [Sphaeroforma arctica JP610]|eukprot:XP_014144048.1 hypothetical protein SARC_17331 [Sphaeroforma arctica JP610]